MKYLLFCLLLCSFVFVSCSKEDETKLELFSTEAFTFDTGSGWEVNVSTRVKGFNQEDKQGTFRSSLSYTLDLIKPEGDTIKALISKVEDKTESEKISDTPIEAQFDLDSSYAVGDYKLLINVKDVVSGRSAASSAQFELRKD